MRAGRDEDRTRRRRRAKSRSIGSHSAPPRSRSGSPRDRPDSKSSTAPPACAIPRGRSSAHRAAGRVVDARDQLQSFAERQRNLAAALQAGARIGVRFEEPAFAATLHGPMATTPNGPPSARIARLAQSPSARPNAQATIAFTNIVTREIPSRPASIDNKPVDKSRDGLAKSSRGDQGACDAAANDRHPGVRLGRISFAGPSAALRLCAERAMSPISRMIRAERGDRPICRGASTMPPPVFTAGAAAISGRSGAGAATPKGGFVSRP